MRDAGPSDRSATNQQESAYDTVRQKVLGFQTSRTRRVGREHYPLLANALMHLVNDGCFVAIYPILPLMTTEFHLTYAQIGLLKTALSTASSAFQLPMAWLVERFGEITLLALGMVWVAAGFMVLGLAVSFWQVLILLFGAG